MKRPVQGIEFSKPNTIFLQSVGDVIACDNSIGKNRLMLATLDHAALFQIVRILQKEFSDIAQLSKAFL